MNKDKISKPKHGGKRPGKRVFMLMALAMIIKQTTQRMHRGDAK